MFIILSLIFIKTENKRLTGTEAKIYIEKHAKEIIIIKIKQLN